MRRTAWLTGCLLAVATLRTAAGEVAAAEDAPLLIASAGTFALVEQYDYPFLLGAQYRGRPLTAWRLRPGIGVDAGPDSRAHVYADVARDVELPRRWLLTLSLGAGWFTNGEQIGAAYDLEFKSGLSLARYLASGARLGLAVYHVSNGGLDGSNNGSEALVLFLGVPLRR
jgi:hypothetical protein